MNKISGMSFAIVMFILIGLGMIISAPSMLNNSQNEKSEPLTQSEDLSLKLQAFENKINERLNMLETRENQPIDNTERITNKYICTIEGNLDEDGNVINIDVSNKYKKFIFACEYKP